MSVCFCWYRFGIGVVGVVLVVAMVLAIVCMWLWEGCCEWCHNVSVMLLLLLCWCCGFDGVHVSAV